MNSGLPATPLFLGLDLGTSSLKALVMDREGQVVARASHGYPLRRPHSGWAEQDPDDWWLAVCSVADTLKRQVTLEQISAIGLSGQMHGLVLLDERGQTLGPCQTWADTRCQRDVRTIERAIPAEHLLELTGSRANTSSTAAKLLWVRRHRTIWWQSARHALLPKDYLRWRLTGAIATDPSDASGTLLCAIAERAWSREVLHALAIPPTLLPPIVASSATTGTLTAEASAALGLHQGTPVVAGGGDAECAAVGLGIVGDASDTGTALVSIGTAGQFFAVTEHPTVAPSGSLQTLCHAVPERWHVMGAILAAASALDWLAAALVAPGMAPPPVDVLLSEAAAVPPGAHGLLFLPHLNGTRMPTVDARATGAFVGLRPEHTRASLARAVVEGVALALRAGLDEARRLNIPITRIRLAGGAQRHPLWARVLADVFALPVELAATEDASALGAAALAAVGVGAWSSFAEVVQRIARAEAVIAPDPQASAAYTRLAAIAQPLTPRLRSTSHALAAFAESQPRSVL